MGKLLGVGRMRTRVTVEEGEGGTTRVYLWSLNVVAFDQDTITLDTGGQNTDLIRARMNEISLQYALGFYVDQEGQNWFVRTWGGTIPFNTPKLTLNRKTMVMPEEGDDTGDDTGDAF